MVGIGTAACLGVTTAALSQQPETAAACEEGNEPLPLSFGDHSSGCAIDPAVDVDTFAFEGVAGDWVRIRVAGNTDGFDPHLEVLDPQGNPLDDHFCDAPWNGRCSFNRGYILPLTGSYSIIVSEAGANHTGAYTLQLERLPPMDEPPTIEYNSTVSDSISPSTDLDFLMFQGEAGSLARFTVAGTTNGFDPCLEIIDPDGTIWLTQCCDAAWNGTCSYIITETLPLTGTYYLVLSEWGINATGGYQVSLQCLFGDCCPGDVNGDGFVDVMDLLEVVLNWGPCGQEPCQSDITADGTVDVQDLLGVILDWGVCP
jgi:hypothetical protein